ncbi:MAG: IS200/IS605 family transposase [Saprospiraceae bacterium]
MADTYIQLYVQLVFSVKGRKSLIPKEHKEEVHKYITGIVQNRRHKLIAINAMRDHIHIFVGLHPDQSISNLVNNIKTGSTKKIKEQSWANNKFSWQNGYGAFSYSRSHIDSVVKYIDNQEQHHKKRTFRAEYLDFLKKFDIEYKDEYLFEFYDDLYDLK